MGFARRDVRTAPRPTRARTRRAILDDGPAPEALDRLCPEYFELADRLMPLDDVPSSGPGPAWTRKKKPCPTAPCSPSSSAA
ncbi:hypothetical protein [Streptomyces sp. 35G-GA-8]|uniref:hypothetical protein n=1 Tax=Streptomyces sp. 35G-GA-8 TaxID=2939434 RepID=UPI00201F3AE2|nr:hypothetical protein [Streptomyces sp. 35G-GA-8]MCL7378220.1 hypothetical protein [Streptomyces sp. 35G-GA-8]